MNIKNPYINYYIVFLCFFLTISNFSQKTKRVTEKNGFGKAKYKVLKSDRQTKHGNYKVTSYTFPYRKLVVGSYNNGLKNGDWKELYDRRGDNNIKVIGQYNNGVKRGIWSYHDLNGRLIHQFDYEENKMILNEECGNKDISYKVDYDGEVFLEELDCPPSRMGGLKMLRIDLINEIVKEYSFKYKGNKAFIVQEYLTFYVDENKNIDHIYYSGTRFHMELFEIIKTWLNSDDNDWIPGELNNQKIKSQIRVPLRFRIRY